MCAFSSKKIKCVLVVFFLNSYDSSESALPPAPSEGPGPPVQKTKTFSQNRPWAAKSRSSQRKCSTQGVGLLSGALERKVTFFVHSHRHFTTEAIGSAFPRLHVVP